jgi:hypothetical protein
MGDSNTSKIYSWCWLIVVPGVSLAGVVMVYLALNTELHHAMGDVGQFVAGWAFLIKEKTHGQ